MRNIVPIVLFALLVAGCGGEPAAKPSPSRGEDQELALKFAQCMRDNGVPEFPDPKFGDRGEQELSLPEGVDKEKVDAAQEKCKQYLPNGGEPQPADPKAIEQTRKFAQCMRENGVPKFPDPDENGGIAIEGGPGLDPMSPEFKAAEEKCAKYGAMAARRTSRATSERACERTNVTGRPRAARPSLRGRVMSELASEPMSQGDRERLDRACEGES